MKLAGPHDFSGVARMFHERAAELRDAPFLHVAEAQGWRTLTWRQLAEEVVSFAAGLQRQGVEPGDRVLLVSENRLEWLVADLAALTAGAIVVPGYASTTPEDWLHAARDSGATLAILSPDVAQRLGGRTEDLRAAVPTIVVFQSASWLELRRRARLSDFEGVLGAVRLDDTACIMYTSGTGGPPKGVETTHRNILGNCLGAATNLAAYGRDEHRFLGFLPFSHTYAHTGDLWTPVAIGAQLFLSRGNEHIAAELAYARPTMMNTVPRFWEVMHKRITTALERGPGVKRRLFEAAVRTGAQRLRGEPPGLLDRVVDAATERAVRAKVLQRFGGELACALCAGSALSPRIATFFNALGIRLHEAYGQTECAPGITMTSADRIVPGAVGTAMLGMEVKLAADGEILARGSNVMKGYWNDPQGTYAVLRDGWLHTGDIGVMEPGGLLRITDRKRDFLKTAGGEMVAPQAVEQVLLERGAIAQAMVCGDARSFLTALVVPSDELRAEHAAGKIDRAGLESHVARAVLEANHALPPVQRVRRHTVLDEPFAVDAGLLTPTLKVRRRAVQAAYAEVIEAMYAA